MGVVQFCITNTLQVSFREPFLIIGYIVMMVAISWELAIFSVLFLPVVALLIGSIEKKLRHPARTNQQRMGEMVSTLDESLSGIKVIKSYNAMNIKQKYYAISADLARLTLSMARRQQLASPMSEFLGITAVGVILVFGGSLRGQRRARPRRIHRLHRHLLADRAPCAPSSTSSPTRESPPESHLLDHRHETRNTGQTRRRSPRG